MSACRRPGGGRSIGLPPIWPGRVNAPRTVGVVNRGKTNMPTIKRKITPFLWFETQAEEAAQFYTSIFDNSRIVRVNRYGKAGRETHGKEAGSVMTVEFEIEGQTLVALNGGPHFRFTEAFSLQVNCETQAEIDYFWSKL